MLRQLWRRVLALPPVVTGTLFGAALFAASWAVGYGLAAATWLWPGPPPQLAAKLETGGVILTWQMPAGETAHHVAVYRDHQYLAYARGGSYIDSDVEAGVSYSYSIVAVDTNHRPSESSNAARVVIPAILATSTVAPQPSASPTPSPTGVRATIRQLLGQNGSSPDPSGNHFVTRRGTDLLLNGQPFHFTGLNIFNATSRNNCGPTLGTGSGLDDALTSWGTGKTVMRTWFFQNLATTGGTRDWAAFDHTLTVAKAHGVRVIVALGNQWGECEQGGFKPASWYAGGYRTDTTGGIVAYRAWVQEVVARYKDDPTILAWQLMNEAETSVSNGGGCASNGAATLRAFADDVGGLVHATDPNHLVSLGTIGTGQCGASGADYAYVHASPGVDLCEFHDYAGTAPLPGDQWNGLATRLSQCRTLGKPLFIGEVGLKPGDVGGLQARADIIGRKIAAAFGAGAAGELAWAWRSTDGYEINPGDPALTALAQF
jgi:mannan endo-1,4-beta-mannosidase